MHDKGLVANSVTYCTMIDGLCKIGKMEQALEVFLEYMGEFCPLQVLLVMCV